MQDATRMIWLRRSLIVIGIIAIFGIHPLTILWPAGFAGIREDRLTICK
jgi:hypothetical protein